MLLAAIILKGLVEVALIVMIGQGILFIFAGATRHQNLVYRMFATVTQPNMKATRFITPRFIVDQHLGFVAFFLLVVLWVVAVALKVHFFIEAGGALPAAASTSPAK
jgi:hypothetical protein